MRCENNRCRSPSNLATALKAECTLGIVGCRRRVSVVGMRSILLIRVWSVRARWWCAHADSVLKQCCEFLVHSMLSVSESPFELEMLVILISLFRGMLMLIPPRPRMCVLCILTDLGCVLLCTCRTPGIFSI